MVKGGKRVTNMVKDTEVEVFCKDDDSWYRAVLEDNPTKSRQGKVRVRLVDQDPVVIKTVDKSTIRPVPPEDLEDDDVLEEGAVVDAYMSNGRRRVGSIEKKLEDESYLVHFNSSPPEISEFERSELRAHLNWTGSGWVQPVNKVRSFFKPETMVELRHDSVWVPAMMVKESDNGKKYCIKDCNKKLSSRKIYKRIFDSVNVRPTQPFSFSVEKYQLMEDVEVLSDGVWRQGVVTGILSKGRYIVRIKSTQLASEFNHSALRPLMEWKDGVWHKTSSKPKLEERNTLKRKRGNVEETRMVLPFTKTSPFWSTFETMEVLPQRPHFRPLSETKEDFREGAALGMMVSFSGLLKKLKNLEVYVTVSQLDSFRDSFVELEKHGFDVKKPLSRINELLAFKDRQLDVMEKLRGESRKKHEAEEEISEVQEKIAELQRKEMVLKKQNDVASEKISELGVELEMVEIGFKTIMSAPW